jgi:2-oxoglutarate dehydrogenase E2 component (dihydrolipoamide succinyltransferase)
MSTEVKVPALPESVSEATVVTWHKQAGDAVERDENLVDLETDKVVLEVPAPEDGVLGEILKTEGDTVTAGEVVAMLNAGAEASTATPSAATASATSAPETAPTPENDASTPSLSPAVRHLVEEHSLDASAIPATGRGGRLLKEDVLRFIEQGGGSVADGSAPASQPASAPAPAPAAPSVTPAPAASAGEREERRVPMTRLRQRIAERLVSAQQEAAMLTTFNEVNMQPVMDLRARYKDTFLKAHDIKLGFMSFFVKATVEALKRFPAVNASIDGTDILYHGYFDVGIAVSTDRGLMVPVLRDADQRSFAEIEGGIADFGQRAQAGKIDIEELTGGTFTITNGGTFGSLVSTPILNPPQSGILGMHKIQERPVAENGQVVVRPMMYLAHSYDHRIIDGKEAVQFLVTIKEMLEDPARLLLEV